jgi:anti-sigma factor RsiW
MACPNEFTWAMYADGELPEHEARQLRKHWAECSDCRLLAAALAEEDRALVLAFQELDQVEVASETVPATPQRAAVELGTFVLGSALLLQAAVDFLSSAQLPPGAEWVNPLRLTGQLNFLAASLVYLFDEGGPMLLSALNTLGFIAVAVLILIAAPRLLRRSIAAGVLLATVVLSLAVSTPASAIDIRSGGRNQESIVVASGETVDDTLIAAGESVIIEGTITGDLIAAARRVLIRGKVQGDVICAGQTVDIDGTVDGNVFGFGQKVQIRGQLGRNLYGFGQEVTADRQSEIRGNAFGFGQQLTVDGNIGRDLTAFVQRVDVSGNIQRGVQAWGQFVSVLSTARIGGNLVAELPNSANLKVQNGASIAGKTDLRVRPPQRSQYATAWFYIWQLVWLVGAFITGMVLFWIFPPAGRPPLNTRNGLLTAGATGFIAAIVTPVAAVIIGITLIGLPIALISVALWALGLYLAKIVLAVFVGRALLPGEGTSVALALVAGLLPILIVVDLPYVGGIANLILTCLGFGALLLAIYRSSTRAHAEPA